MLRQVKPNGEYKVMTNKEALDIVLKLANEHPIDGLEQKELEALAQMQAYLDYDENIRED